nr:MAG TPA: hypothetical protein [Caudoviricetes sp.]
MGSQPLGRASVGACDQGSSLVGEVCWCWGLL